MGKSVASGVIPCVPCLRKKDDELGSISKSLETTMKKLEAPRRGVKVEMGSNGVAAMFGALSTTKASGLLQGELQLKLGCLNSSPALGDIGKATVLPIFDGSNSSSFRFWLCEVRSCLMNQCFSDLKKCELIVSCLKGPALLWYTTLNLSRLTKGKSMIRSWHKLELHLKEKYAPSSTLDEVRADVYALKQNLLSVSKGIKPYEMNQPMCEKNLEPKPEMFEQTKLEMACSLEKVNYVSDACLVRCLNPMENESLTIDHEGDDESLYLAPSKPQKLSKSSLTPTYNENKDQLADLEPLEGIVDQGLPDLQTLRFGQSLMMFSGGECWDSIKNKVRGESWVIPHSNVSNLTPCTRPDFCFTTSCLGGLKCVLLTPHFHFYMLMRLQTSLAHSSTILYMLRMRNGERKQFKTCCPVLKLLSLEVNLVEIPCKNLLELLGISCASYLPSLGGFSGLLKMVMLGLMHKNSSIPLSALLCSTGCLKYDHGLSLGAYMLLVIQCAIIEVKLGVEPPWPFGEGYMGSIEEKTRMGIEGGNESVHPYGLNVQVLILVTELLSASPRSPTKAVMVFDPGGRDVKLVHEQNCSFDQAWGVGKVDFIQMYCEKLLKLFGTSRTWLGEQCKCGVAFKNLLPFTILIYNPGGINHNYCWRVQNFFSLNPQNLRSNSFEPGEVAAGAKGRGLSFSMPKEQSMGLPKGMP